VTLLQERLMRPEVRYAKAPPPPVWGVDERRRMVSSLLVAASVFIYGCVFGCTPFLEVVANGILWGMATNVAFRAKTAVIVVAALAIVFLVVRALNGDPELPNAGGQERGQVDDPTPAPTPAPDPKPVEGGEIDPLLRRFEARDRSFLERLLSGDVGVVRDKAGLDSVRAWIEHVRAARQRLSKRKAEVARLSSLRDFVEHPAVLFELGLLDASSLRPRQDEGPSITEAERIERAMRSGAERTARNHESTGRSFTVEIFTDGTSDSESRDASGEPVGRKGMLKLVSPRLHGYTFIAPGELARMTPPVIGCDAIREVVLHYVRQTGDQEFMKAWKVVTRSRANPSNFVRKVDEGRGADLDRIEEDCLGGEVPASTAKLLARFYEAYEKDIEELEHFITCQRLVGGLASATLKEAHRRVRAMEASQRARRIKRRQSENRGPYYVSNRTPVQTMEQRRGVLRAAIQGSVPKKKRGW
jgi:hypothetical protein